MDTGQEWGTRLAYKKYFDGLVENCTGDTAVLQ